MNIMKTRKYKNLKRAENTFSPISAPWPKTRVFPTFLLEPFRFPNSRSENTWISNVLEHFRANVHH